MVQPKGPGMTPPTLHELAGIFMLALAATLFISHPSSGLHSLSTPIEEPAASLNGFAIDDIVSVALRRP